MMESVEYMIKLAWIVMNSSKQDLDSAKVDLDLIHLESHSGELLLEIDKPNSKQEISKTFSKNLSHSLAWEDSNKEAVHKQEVHKAKQKAKMCL